MDVRIKGDQYNDFSKPHNLTGFLKVAPEWSARVHEIIEDNAKLPEEDRLSEEQIKRIAIETADREFGLGES